MAEMIDRKATIDYLVANMCWYDEDGYEVDDSDEKRKYITELISGVTTVDAKPVVHAHWVGSCEEHILPDTNGEVGPESCICSHCGAYLGGSGEYIVDGKFCPSCGARMDEPKDGDESGKD